MAKLNMTNMNTLIKKGYLLAGVIMAANMFVVNEMKAMEKLRTDNNPQGSMSLNQRPNIRPRGQQFLGNNNFMQNNTVTSNEDVWNKMIQARSSIGQKEKNPGKDKTQSGPSIMGKLLSLENYFNLFGTLALSGANNYFKWWDYNPGKYQELGCRGWRSKRLLNDIFQFEINLNGIRGLLWLIPGIIEARRRDTKAKNEISKLNTSDKVVSFIIFILHFVSMPLTVHLSNFSISISLDSIIWGIVGKILEPKGEKGKEKIKPVRIVKKIDN